jgi:hypothetical protein
MFTIKRNRCSRSTGIRSMTVARRISSSSQARAWRASNTACARCPRPPEVRSFSADWPPSQELENPDETFPTTGASRSTSTRRMTRGSMFRLSAPCGDEPPVRRKSSAPVPHPPILAAIWQTIEANQAADRVAVIVPWTRLGHGLPGRGISPQRYLRNNRPALPRSARTPCQQPQPGRRQAREHNEP